ncbi:hypothetical protein LG634_13380 [Streptomyces bambusae]|uniref:hypothetical protein n=1 Tax=Streptomyces bambusae TaxID=1550616 RepID=UPI001CFD1FE9|nr:hypothetical protein [Streptomyces bambusae]MCB5165822.1 hypothetical protein [Streptomyces bambusae]
MAAEGEPLSGLPGRPLPALRRGALRGPPIDEPGRRTGDLVTDVGPPVTRTC